MDLMPLQAKIDKLSSREAALFANAASLELPKQIKAANTDTTK